MSAAAPSHRCRVLQTPWPGVFGTHADSARHYGRHWHASFGFGVLEQGAQASASGRGPVDARAGDLITTNPGEVHDGRPLHGPSRRWRMLYLEPDAMAALAGPGAPPDLALARPVLQDAGLRDALHRLFGRLDAWAAGDVETLACEEALVAAAGLLLARHASRRVAPPPAPADLRRVRDRLADERLEPPTLADLAAMAGLSRFQVLRRFEKTYGLPPHAWLQQQRAERARTLIRAGLPLAEAAAAAGFADQSHLTRVFVRRFGFTPGAWRGLQSRSRPPPLPPADCGA